MTLRGSLGILPAVQGGLRRFWPACRALLGKWLRGLDAMGANYRLTRFMLLRLTGFVYFFAFLSFAQQGLALVGREGLLPAEVHMAQATKQLGGSVWEGFLKMPSIFWFHVSDALILAVAWGGTGLALLVLVGFANMPILFLLWAFYLSLLPIGQEWLAYGWDIQILETGFLAVLLAPPLDWRPFPSRNPPVLILWLYRWLIFRIMLGAGLIKLRGDEAWRDLTALLYHYETQPIPGPLSRFFHFLPAWIHKGGVLGNHFVELVVPWFAFVWRPGRHIAGVLMIGFQVVLILSGNLSFLNWLTIIPCLACLDDSFWARLLPKGLVARVKNGPSVAPPHRQILAAAGYALLVAWLSIAPVTNLISSRQAMNSSFDPLRLVNTYGAFGSMDRERFELVFEGTTSPLPGSDVEWRAYEFKAKPTDPMRRPVWITPYHYRLDWAAWFPWTKVPGRNAWLPHFLWKLLHNDPKALSLLAKNPFPSAPPARVRVVVYRYRYAPAGNSEGLWWEREFVGTLIRPFTAESHDLQQFLRQQGFLE